jgi:four helix bundle protein
MPEGAQYKRKTIRPEGGTGKMRRTIQRFRELEVYKKAFALQQEIFEITKSFPMEERFSLTDQIRRSSRSIGSNISEAWHKRRYIAHFVSKLTDSDGEQAETQHWLDTSFACNYVSLEDHRRLLNECEEIGRMLGGTMANAESFCRRFATKQ